MIHPIYIAHFNKDGQEHQEGRNLLFLDMLALEYNKWIT
jgi:hypothetical protein